MGLFDFLSTPAPEGETLRGGKKLDPSTAERVSAGYGGPTFPLVGLQIPKALAFRGCVLQGHQGSGKSLEILHLISQKLNQIGQEGPDGKGTLIVFDLKGDLTAPVAAMANAVHPPLPVHILNPFDLLSWSIDPHEFADEPTKISRLVHALTYRSRDTRSDDFFDSSARGHLIDLVKILQTRVPGKWSWRTFKLIATDMDLFHRVLECSRIGRPKSKAFVKKVFAGIVATIEAWLGQYETVFACYEKSPVLRLDEFLSGRGVIIISAPEDQKDSIAPMCRVLLRNIKDRLLTAYKRHPSSHTMIILDEFAYLNDMVEVILPLLGQSRSASAAVVGAWQSWAATCEAHGEKRMKGFLDNAGIRVYYGCGAQSAKIASEDCASTEQRREEESRGFRKGIVESKSVSHRIELRQNVLPGEIQNLGLPTAIDLTVRAFVCANHLPGPVYCEADRTDFVGYLKQLPRIPGFRPRPTTDYWLEPWDDVKDGNALAELFVPEEGVTLPGRTRRKRRIQRID